MAPVATCTKVQFCCFPATSNAPRRSRKRRLSSTEREEVDEEQSEKKKARAESATPSVVDAEATFLAPKLQTETVEVKEVTKGVEEVALDGKQNDFSASSSETTAPESIPLPEETSGELDDAGSNDDEASSSGSKEEDGEEQELIHAANVPLPKPSLPAEDIISTNEPSHDDDKSSDAIDSVTVAEPIESAHKAIED